MMSTGGVIWVIITLLIGIFLIVFNRRISRLTEGATCSPCPAKPPRTYYTSTSGCATAACKSLADCPNVGNATKTITPCMDPVAGVSAGSPGECGFTCNSGYTKNANGCAAVPQLTPIQRFKMDWGKQALSGSVAMSSSAASAPVCANNCVNAPGCTAFVMDWSNSSGSLGDNVGGCTLYSSLTPKVSSRPRAVYSKIQ